MRRSRGESTMLAKKYSVFQNKIKKHLKGFKKKKPITEGEFDSFIERIISDKSLDLSDKVYCRDGFAFINQIDHHTFQIPCFQINTFGKEYFRDSVVKLCTPILLTVKAHGSGRRLNHGMKHSCLTIEDFYLGKHFSGSKGKLCDRDQFNSHARMLFLSEPNINPFGYHIVYRLMKANYICHHIAEVMGYAFGALDVCWRHKKDSLFLSSGSHFNQRMDKLYIDIIENFSSDRMRGFFQIPHYAKLYDDIERFKEEHDNMLWEVTYRKESETFYLPVGYQKVRKKMFHKNVNVVTTQHILEHILTAYYRRKNSFVVANTFQTLEYLSRAFIAKREGRTEESGKFVKSVSTCLGHYPERDFVEYYEKEKEKYPAFVSEYSHTMFFRPPVLL